MRLLALDTETAGGAVDRVSLACRCCYPAGVSWDWSLPVADRVRAELARHDRVAAHNAPFDLAELGKVRVAADERCWWDTAECHRLLYPQSLAALGHAAPFYLVTEPWKHLDREDPGRYSTLDALVALAIAEKQAERLTEKGMLRLFTEVVGPAWLALGRMERRPVRFPDRERVVRHVPAGRAGLAGAAYGELRASWGPGNSPGRYLPVPSYPGWGVARLRFLAPHQELKDVLGLDGRQQYAKARRDGFLATPLGRRGYALTPTESRDWVVRATFADVLRGTLVQFDRVRPAEIRPLYLLHDGLMFEHEPGAEPVPAREWDEVSPGFRFSTVVEEVS